MSQITLRFSEDDFKSIQRVAMNQGQTVSDLATEAILKAVGIHSNASNAKLSIADIDRRAGAKLQSGDQFTVKSLFKLDEWKSFEKGNELSTGRSFNQAVINSEHPFNTKYKYIGKDSANTAIYEVL